MSDVPVAYWILLSPKDTPDATALGWAGRVRQLLAPHAPGWTTVVVTSANDFKACAPVSRGRPDWGAWVEGIPVRYGGLVVPLIEPGIVVGRATSDILEAAGSAAEPPHRLGFGTGTNTLHQLTGIEANWKGDERPWKAWSRLHFEGWPIRVPVRTPPTGGMNHENHPREPARSTSSDPDAADFIARCDEVLEYADDVLGDRRGDAARAFLDSIVERVSGMRSWAVEHDHCTEKMQQAVENIDSGISRWERH